MKPFLLNFIKTKTFFFLATSILLPAYSQIHTSTIHTGNPLTKSQPVTVEFFFQPGCEECIEVKEYVLPEISDMFGASITVLEYNTNVKTNYLRLTTLMDKAGVKGNENVSIFINEHVYLGGISEIRDQLAWCIGESLANTGSRKHPVSENQHNRDGEAILAQRLKTFTITAVALAGLADGFNPCAFTAIIFFASLLTMSKRKHKDILIMGTAFCASVFFTYLALGFGIFGGLRALPLHGMPTIIIKWSMAVLLAILAFLSFRDAWRYRNSGNSRDITLRLPDSIINRIHSVLRKRVTSGKLLIGALTAGFIVTLIESVCTGQLYLPTLVYLSGHEIHYKKALSLLLLYNLAFITPLILVLAAVYLGAKNNKLTKWSRNNAVQGKIGMGIVFIILAILMLAT